MSAEFWVCGVVTLVSASVSLAYSLAGLRGAGSTAEVVASRYAAARSAALAVTAVVGLFSGSVGFVAAVALAMILVQALDTFVGAGIRDTVKTVGPAATAVANLAALVWLLAG